MKHLPYILLFIYYALFNVAFYEMLVETSSLGAIVVIPVYFFLMPVTFMCHYFYIQKLAKRNFKNPILYSIVFIVTHIIASTMVLSDSSNPGKFGYSYSPTESQITLVLLSSIFALSTIGYINYKNYINEYS